MTDVRPACPLTVQEISDILARDSSSPRKAQARVGERYYNGDNDILKHRIFYFDGDGELVEDRFASNVRISHAFFPELVDQKVDYLISPRERHVRSADEHLDAFLAPYFDEAFNAALAEACRDASKNGFGYLYAYTAEDGTSRFDCAEALGVAEVRERSSASDCDYVVYRYIDHVDYGATEVERVQVWDDTWTWYFAGTDGSLAPDTDVPENPKAHRQWTDERGGEFYSGFACIPFWRIDNNRRQISDLAPVKAIIDDYDLMKCGLSNNLEDLTEGYVVVKGYSGDDGSLTEMITNLRRKRHVGVSEDGDVDIRTVQIPYDARKANMDTDRENIYQFGMGLNTAGLADTSATTNMAIKAAYALLDLKCNRFETQLRAALSQMVAFVIDEINRFEGTAYDQSDVEVSFERIVMTNAQDTAQTALIEAQEQQTRVATLLNAATVYGDEAVLEAVCAVLDLDADEVGTMLPSDEDGGAREAAEALMAGE